MCILIHVLLGATETLDARNENTHGIKTKKITELAQRWLELWHPKHTKDIVSSAAGGGPIQSPECQNLLQQLEVRLFLFNSSWCVAHGLEFFLV